MNCLVASKALLLCHITLRQSANCCNLCHFQGRLLVQDEYFMLVEDVYFKFTLVKTIFMISDTLW